MHFPVHPADSTAIDLEGYAFGLSNVDWFEVSSESAFCFNCCCVVIVWWCGVDWAADFWNIDVDDFVGVCVEDGTKVERVCVLTVVLVGSIVHESLLETDSGAESFVIANRPCCIQC
jgi:hypothetical protein